MRVHIVVALAATFCASVAIAQQVETILRHDNFLVFEGEIGETVGIAVTSMRKAGFVYGDDLMVEVIDPTSERTLRRIVPLGTAEVIEYEVRTAGLHAVRLSAGWNTMHARVEGKPWALVASQDVPVSICGAMAPLHFKVLDGVESFTVTLQADVTGEGAALRVHDPDGDLVLEEIGDFDDAAQYDIEVPGGADNAVWSLTITDPEQEGLALDDVTFHLGGHVPPLLCEDPAWIELFTAGEEYQPDLIDTVVQVGDTYTLNEGESVTVTWEMAELPEGKTYALRITGNDVDYGRELMARLNGGEPFAIPITGNSTSATFTLLLEREQLRVGENTLELTQDPSGGSNVVLAGDIQILIGDRIKEYRGY